MCLRDLGGFLEEVATGWESKSAKEKSIRCNWGKDAKKPGWAPESGGPMLRGRGFVNENEVKG